MKLYKFRSFENIEYTMDIIMKERLYCAHHKSLNDPFEGLFSMIEMRRRPQMLSIGGDSFGGSGFLNVGGGGIGLAWGQGKIRTTVYKTLDDLPEADTTRICSLSSSMSDVRMWSLYASGHTGCVIEIDLEPDEKEIVEVKYDEGLRHFQTKETNDTKAIDILSFKTNHWEYEQEYRIVSEQTYYPVPEKITGVYLGIRAKEIYKELMVHCTPKKIPVYETQIQEHTVEIVPKEKIN